MALADARVVSVPATLDRSVSRTPDLRLSTSMFDTVLLSTSIVLFVRVLDVAARYVSNVSTVVWRIVPPSLVTIPSPPATAVVPAEVSPSIIFSSVVVTVAPSSISNSVSEISALPIVRVPDISTLPLMSTVVAAICISVSATKSSCPSVLELI